MPSARGLHRVVNIEDLRLLARRRVPLPIFDYVDGGAEGEVTLRDNRQVWERILFRPRNATAIGQPDLRANVLGFDLAMPFLLAPIGFTRLLNHKGEVAVATAAGAEGIGYVMSSFAGYPCEDVARASRGPLWYQLYLAGGRAVTEATIERAWKAGFRALAVTIDTNCPGMRERDLHNGSPALMSGNLAAMLPYLPSVLRKPAWTLQFLLDRDAMFFPNIQIPGVGPAPAADVRSMLTGAVVTWADLKWIRAAWPGPILAKGVITGDDARRAVDEGCAGMVVSNHGGRQLDTSYPTAKALPEVLAAVNGRVPVLVDGGIRRGADIVKAICMGASAVLIGRAYVYGLMAAGQGGIAKAISIFRADLERTMGLLGCRSLGDLNSSHIDISGL